MNLEINHIFIFCDNHDEVAQELIDFGFTEGSGRIHPNQGTENRKFHFKNFYLELLWVHNRKEVTNALTSSTKLYERSMYHVNGYSPFGLCLNYDTNDDTLFQNALIYKPTYLPFDMHIEVLIHDDTPSLPWTFRWKADRYIDINSEFVAHENAIKTLTKAVFSLPKGKEALTYTKHFKNTGILYFEDSREISLTLFFDNAQTKYKKVFDTVSLVIEY